LADGQATSISGNIVAEDDATHAGLSRTRLPHQENLLLLGLLDLVADFGRQSGWLSQVILSVGSHDAAVPEGWAGRGRSGVVGSRVSRRPKAFGCVLVVLLGDWKQAVVYWSTDVT
jgi:hypothetical protein